MFDDFDDFDFDPDDLESSSDKVEQMPIYKKAIEIMDTVQDICDLIPDDDSVLAHIKGFLLEDSMLIPAKISSRSRRYLRFTHGKCNHYS